MKFQRTMRVLATVGLAGVLAVACRQPYSTAEAQAKLAPYKKVVEIQGSSIYSFCDQGRLYYYAKGSSGQPALTQTGMICSPG